MYTESKLTLYTSIKTIQKHRGQSLHVELSIFHELLTDQFLIHIPP